VTDRHSPSGKAFWICLAIGWTLMVFGVAGMLDEGSRTHPANFGLWFVGSALIHDLLLAPVVFLVAVWLGRIVPSGVRPIVQAGLVVAAPIVVVALPLVAGQGGAPGNPSALPRNYPMGLILILSAVAVATGLGVWRSLRQAERARPYEHLESTRKK
jgi:hypothetical protein